MSRTLADTDEKTGVVEDDFLYEMNLCLALKNTSFECLLNCYDFASNLALSSYLTFAYSFSLHKVGVIVISHFIEKQTN